MATTTTTHPDDEAWAAEEAAIAQPAAPVSPAARLWAFLRGPYPTLISRLALGGIFFLAGLTKLGVPASFTDSINAYEMPLPAPLVQLMAAGLPPLEVLLGLWLLAGLFTRLVAAISGGLMVVFLIAITQASMRGLDITCGCVAGPGATTQTNPLGLALVNALGPVGKFLTSEKVGPEAIVRDVIFLLMAIHLILVPTVFGIDSWRRARHQAALDAYTAAELEEAEEASHNDWTMDHRR